MLTASIEPGEVENLRRVNWQLRRSDYCAALEFYCKLTDPEKFSILVVENTGAGVADLEQLASSNGHRLSVISYKENQSVSRKGKGNGEALMFNRIADWLSQSKSSEEFESIIKITGRLEVRNLVSIVSGMPKNTSFFAARIYSDLTYIDTKFFISDPLTWTRYLTNLEPLVRESEGRYLEHACALSAARMRYDGVAWVPFRIMPSISGVSGSTGQKYGTLRDRIRNFQSLLVHWVWHGGFI
ncbi:hypothetical protein KUG88_08170 [Rhodococcus rhodochrous]|uniref:hypothetical protein n=1 Tax=Rhodococcus rhodochrous TaxID=1829 RepID=UPI001E3C888A|nr:hypothetical protein [Rhodococcus rhodochrous]MCB8910105.1 hypothetical protein [Rhodococcus rhodochrous]